MAHKLISKPEAERLRLKTYYTGEPCDRGHKAERYTNSGKCIECHKERNRRNRSKTAKTTKSKAVSKAAPAGATVVPVTPINSEPVHKDRRFYADRITATFTATVQNTVRGFIATGALLIQAKDNLDHGEFLEMIERELPFGARAAQMFMAIAANAVLSNTNHGSYLPPSWRTLYELTKLPEPVLLDKIKEGTINPEMERSDVEVIVASIAKPNIIEAEAVEVKAVEAEWPKSLPKSPEPEVTEAEVIEETPPPAVPVRDDVLDYAVVHLEGAVDRILGAEKHPFDKLVAALSEGFLISTPENLEKAAAILMRLAEAMRQKAAA